MVDCVGVDRLFLLSKTSLPNACCSIYLQVDLRARTQPVTEQNVCMYVEGLESEFNALIRS